METRIALVTGSGRRLGRKIAVALASAGFDIVAHYHNSLKDVRQTKDFVVNLGRRCLTVRADLCRHRDVQKMFMRIRKQFGRIDLVVNNAAIFPKSVDFHRISEDEWDRVLSSNLKSAFLCSQQAVLMMRKRSGGQIINIASLGAFLGWKKHIHYSVSKAGVVSLTSFLAKALAPGIRVNCVAPGTIIVPGEETTSQHLPSVDKIPMNRYGKPQDITDAVVYLAQSEYLTGQVLHVDGGVTLR